MLLTEPILDSTRFNFSFHHPIMALDRVRAEDATWDENRRQLSMSQQAPAEDLKNGAAAPPSAFAQDEGGEVALPETSQSMSVLDRATELSNGLDLPGPPTWSVHAAITSQIYQENCPLSCPLSSFSMEPGQNLGASAAIADGAQGVDASLSVFDGNGNFVRNIMPSVQAEAAALQAPAGAIELRVHAPPPVGHIGDMIGLTQNIMPTSADAHPNLHLDGMVGGAGKRDNSLGMVSMQNYPLPTMANPADSLAAALPIAAESTSMPMSQYEAVMGETQHAMPQQTQQTNMLLTNHQSGPYLAMAPQPHDASWNMFQHEQQHEQHQQHVEEAPQTHIQVHQMQEAQRQIEAQAQAQVQQQEQKMQQQMQQQVQQVQQQQQQQQQLHPSSLTTVTPKRTRGASDAVKDSQGRQPVAKRRKRQVAAPASAIQVLQDVANETFRQQGVGPYTKRERRGTGKGLAAKGSQHGRVVEPEKLMVGNILNSVVGSWIAPSASNVILPVCKFVSKRTEVGCSCKLVVSKHKRGHLCVMCKQGHQWVWCRDCCKCPSDNPSVRGCHNKSHWFERDSFDTGKRNHMNRHE